ncbi:unnamed protein product [Effrenium voratum]|uniref:Glutamyl-tRNA reductase N-terminal domain-containing protein n=1 Tax=Effrenium voratum TaxID=2562239 RepID=A0AA36I383_9DINO|nr:unnamed protein product [Effrenium voratum]
MEPRDAPIRSKGVLCLALAPLVPQLALCGFPSHRWLAPSEIRLRSPRALPVEDTVHVVTLRKPGDQVHACAWRRCWTWKERVLGDGHDFFVPRQKTTAKLAKALLREEGLEEVAVLGNCKRLDIYVASERKREELPEVLAAALCRQMAWHRTFAVGWLCQVLDVPEAVAEPADCEKFRGQVAEEALRLLARLELRSGEESAAYLCRVAAALEGRDKEKFDPCNAREAHIMLQLKRSLEAVDDHDGPCGRRLRLLLRMALEAGKAARSATLPELAGLGSKASRRAAFEAAEVKVVKPQVAKCVAKLRGLRHGRRVAALRARAAELLEAAELRAGSEAETRARRRVSRLLHAPSLALKAGRQVDEQQLLQQLSCSEGCGASQDKPLPEGGKTAAELGAINGPGLAPGLRPELLALLRGEAEPVEPAESEPEGPELLKGMSAEQRAMLFID